jgi:putative ABC transport system permease protein
MIYGWNVDNSQLMTSYSLTILWHERQRYLAAVLAVGFSALLVALQCGLVVGMLSFATLPIEMTKADIWVGGPALASMDLGTPIPERFIARLSTNPEVERCEVYLQAFTSWFRRDGTSELCMVTGSRLGSGALGAVDKLTPELRSRLAEPGAVVIDESDRGRLGVKGIGDVGEIAGRRVHVVGMVNGLRGLLGTRIFCSIQTARRLLDLKTNQTIFLLARCHTPSDASAVIRRLRAAYSDLSAYSSADFAWRTRIHWLTKTKAGIALGCAALLGLLVGAVITSQTLSAAAAASRREYAVLRALGIPRWRLGSLILVKSFWVGVIGTLFALPLAFVLGHAAEMLGVKVMLPAWLLLGTVAITMVMALASSLGALRQVQVLEPVTLLR